MAALCAPCNLAKGAKMLGFDLRGLREGQKQALEVILDRIRQKQSHTAIVMATRYGKSDLQRIATIAAIDAGLACAGISLSPNTVLRDQMSSEEKWNKFTNRIRLRGIMKRASIKTCVHNPSVNGEVFLSTTIQFFTTNLTYWIDYAKGMTSGTGLPVILFIDECQFNSKVNEWGKKTNVWQQETGGHIVLATAIPDRTDDEAIPGFEYRELSVQEVIEYKTRPSSDPEKIWVDVLSGEKKRLQLLAHHTTNFEQAWDEGVICKVAPRWFDMNLRDIDDGTEGLLSELRDRQHIRRALSRGVRHPITIRGAVAFFVDALRLMRRVDPQCAGIIFCGNDTDVEDENEVNSHARKIKKELLDQMSELSKSDIIIATSADGTGVEEVKRFSEKYQGTSLVVKQMASLGLDVSRLKVGLDLSPTRTRAAVIQREMRIATPHDIPGKPTLMTCIWISPNDVLARAIFQSVVTNAGGETVIKDLELIKSYEKDRTESPLDPNHVVIGVVGAGAEDNRKNTATEPEIEEVRRYFDLVPEIVTHLTYAELAARLKKQKEQPMSSSSDDTEKKAILLRKQINDAMTNVIKAACGPGYNQKIYAKIAKDKWTKLYRICQVPHELRLEQINDLDMLHRLRSFAQSNEL
jgi:hypothetical protein